MLEVVLATTVVLVYGIQLDSLVPLVLATLSATVGVAAAGTLYGVLAAGLRVRETGTGAALAGGGAGAPGGHASLGGVDRRRPRRCLGRGRALLRIFAVLFVGIGMLAFGPLLEES